MLLINLFEIYLLNNKRLLIGTEESIICVDYTSRTIVLNMSIIDFYGNQDPYQRNLKSPRKSKVSESFFANTEDTNDNNVNIYTYISINKINSNFLFEDVVSFAF